MAAVCWASAMAARVRARVARMAAMCWASAMARSARMAVADADRVAAV